jgi:hypothetical protein
MAYIQRAIAGNDDLGAVACHRRLRFRALPVTRAKPQADVEHEQIVGGVASGHETLVMASDSSAVVVLVAVGSVAWSIVADDFGNSPSEPCSKNLVPWIAEMAPVTKCRCGFVVKQSRSIEEMRPA